MALKFEKARLQKGDFKTHGTCHSCGRGWLADGRAATLRPAVCSAAEKGGVSSLGLLRSAKRCRSGVAAGLALTAATFATGVLSEVRERERLP